jgi:hypothetical protein
MSPDLPRPAKAKPAVGRHKPPGDGLSIETARGISVSHDCHCGGMRGYPAERGGVHQFHVASELDAQPCRRLLISKLLMKLTFRNPAHYREINLEWGEDYHPLARQAVTEIVEDEVAQAVIAISGN